MTELRRWPLLVVAYFLFGLRVFVLSFFLFYSCVVTVWCGEIVTAKNDDRYCYVQGYLLEGNTGTGYLMFDVCFLDGM